MAILERVKVYELRTYDWDMVNDPENLGSNDDYAYVVTDGGDWTVEEMLAAGDICVGVPGGNLHWGCKLEIHEARSGVVIFHKDGSYDVDDCDTATGCNGCPIVENYYDGYGRLLDYDQVLEESLRSFSEARNFICPPPIDKQP